MYRRFPYSLGAFVLKDYIEDRVYEIAEYIVRTGCTVRACAGVFRVSQSTVHNIRVVTAFAVPDCPGGLAKVLSLLETTGVNIEYLYALVTSDPDKAYAVMRTDDEERAERILVENNIELLDEEHI